jgi:hypothetical protein
MASAYEFDLERANIFGGDAQPIRDYSERMLVWPLDLATLDSGDLFCRHPWEVTLPNAFLDPQPAQRAPERAVGFQLTLLRPSAGSVIKLVQDGIRGGLVIT